MNSKLKETWEKTCKPTATNPHSELVWHHMTFAIYVVNLSSLIRYKVKSNTWLTVGASVILQMDLSTLVSLPPGGDPRDDHVTDVTISRVTTRCQSYEGCWIHPHCFSAKAKFSIRLIRNRYLKVCNFVSNVAFLVGFHTITVAVRVNCVKYWAGPGIGPDKEIFWKWIYSCIFNVLTCFWK